MSNSRWGDIYNKLKEKGFDVYAPAQHEGECVAPYVVVKVGNLMQVGSFSSVQYFYDILCYIPKDEYSTLENYVEEVKKAMKELQPMIMPIHTQTGSYYDDGVKGHMISIQYRNNRKL